jgi:hypothetical protein
MRKTETTPGGEPKPGETLSIKGVLTAQGVECQAFRGDNGTLYTLSGSIGSYRTGDRVCVKGHPVEMSICQQGTTIQVESIGPEGDCP